MLKARFLHTLAGLICLGTAAIQPAMAASIVTEWLDIAVPAAQDATPEPTSAARFFAVLHTAMYEAWAAYDDTAAGVVTGKLLKRTGGEPTIANKREAISNAAYVVLLDLARPHRKAIEQFMKELGYSPASDAPAARLGRRAAAAVLAMRRSDGSNQSDLYRDTSSYAYADPADRDQWQPAAVEIMHTKALAPVTPHWHVITPFALPRADAFRPPAPPAFGTPGFDTQIAQILDLSAALTDEQKAMSEYWSDFISSPGPHIIELTKFLSLRDDYRLDADVKLFFAVSNGLLDAAISCWDAKYHYNYVRPYTAIRNLGDRKVLAWDNPNLSAASNHLPNSGHAIDWGYARKAREMPARQWLPYLPTPPFPSYVSGHSQFTAAWARVMELMTGSPAFGYRTEWPKLYVENRWLNKPVNLEYPTFWSAAEASGLSRLYGGIHWPVDNSAGLEAGRKVGQRVWDVAQRYFSGDARPLWMAGVSLAPPIWQRASLASGAALTTEGGLRITFDPSQGQPLTGWQTVAFDPPPAGRYRASGVVHVAGDGPSSLSLSLSAIDPGSSGRVLAASENAVTIAGDAAAIAPIPIEVDFDANGTTPLRLAFQARATGAGQAIATLRAMKIEKVDPFADDKSLPERSLNWR